MKTILDLLGMFLRLIAVLIGLVAGAVVLVIAGLLGQLQDSNR
jgi:xanthine/uracil permease